MRAQLEVVGTAIGSDDQACFQAHIQWLDDEVLNFGRAEAGNRRLNRPTGGIAQVDRVHLLACL
ncbi:hypothetical protein D3C85_1717190 [compost metagenome]